MYNQQRQKRKKKKEKRTERRKVRTRQGTKKRVGAFCFLFCVQPFFFLALSSCVETSEIEMRYLHRQLLLQLLGMFSAYYCRYVWSE